MSLLKRNWSKNVSWSGYVVEEVDEEGLVGRQGEVGLGYAAGGRVEGLGVVVLRVRSHV